MYTAKETEDRISDVKLAASRAKNEARATASNIRDELESAAHRTGRSVREFLQAANDEISHASDVVTTRIHDKPVQSSAIALGIGVVLGAILLRR